MHHLKIINVNLKITTEARGRGGGGTLHMKGGGTLVGNFELNPLKRPIQA